MKISDSEPYCFRRSVVLEWKPFQTSTKGKFFSINVDNEIILNKNYGYLVRFEGGRGPEASYCTVAGKLPYHAVLVLGQ